MVSLFHGFAGDRRSHVFEPRARRVVSMIDRRPAKIFLGFPFQTARDAQARVRLKRARDDNSRGSTADKQRMKENV